MNKFSLWPSISIQKQYLNNSETALILLDVAHQHHFCFNLTTKFSYYLAILNETQSLCNLINEATLNFSKLQLFKRHFQKAFQDRSYTKMLSTLFSSFYFECLIYSLCIFFWYDYKKTLLRYVAFSLMFLHSHSSYDYEKTLLGYVVLFTKSFLSSANSNSSK